MNAPNLKTVLQSMRSLGPYVLVELLLPGGTLIAGLLWLTQHVRRRYDVGVQPRPVASSVVSLRLEPRVSRMRQVRLALRALTFKQKLHHFRHDGGGTLIEFRRRQVGDGVGHREEAKIRKTPGAGHSATGGFENVRDDRSGRNPVLFKHYAVEHTARAA
jgi:hypothetical protein